MGKPLAVDVQVVEVMLAPDSLVELAPSPDSLVELAPSPSAEEVVGSIMTLFLVKLSHALTPSDPILGSRDVYSAYGKYVVSPTTVFSLAVTEIESLDVSPAGRAVVTVVPQGGLAESKGWLNSVKYAISDSSAPPIDKRLL